MWVRNDMAGIREIILSIREGKNMLLKTDKCYIVAEIGGNFTDLETAKLLIDQAAECGVDAVKLQTYRAETLVSGSAVFDMENIKGISQVEYFKKYEIDEEMHRQIYRYAKEKGLDIFSTPTHYTDVMMLEKLGTDIYKIGADDAVNIPFLKKVAALNKPIMLSTGMCTLDEVKMAVNAVLEVGNPQLIIMHTVSLYPTRDEYVNLNVLNTFFREFPEFVIGYSDHTLGVDACIYAAAMGAKVIEKHFTFDKNADGPDHILSADKEDMMRLVAAVRQFETMRGNGIKMPMSDEVKNRRNNRKSIIAIRDIKKGEIFSEDNIDIKRPGMGMAPRFYEEVIGKRAAKDMEKDTLLQWTDIEA